MTVAVAVLVIACAEILGPTGEHPFSVALGDLNGDGKLDVTVAFFLADTISVLLGR